MIIDLILDRKDGHPYNAEGFYLEIMEYESIFEMDKFISTALAYGTNADIQKALCDYIDNGDYNEQIKDYINSQEWL